MTGTRANAGRPRKRSTSAQRRADRLNPIITADAEFDVAEIFLACDPRPKFQSGDKARRPALSFVDTSVALPVYPDATAVHKTLGTPPFQRRI